MQHNIYHVNKRINFVRDELNNMNRKSEEMNHIIDTVIGCCITKVSEDGPVDFTRKDVVGSERTTPLVMTRCLVVSNLLSAGFSVATIANVMKKSPQGVRNLLRLGIDYHRTSRAYRIAEEEAKCLLSHPTLSSQTDRAL